MPHKIVRGQRIEAGKIDRARQLRGAMTPTERILWQVLRRNALRGLHFRRQQVIAGFIVDFYCHTAALAVAIDGEVHQQRSDYDRDRDRILTAAGVQVIRFANADVIGNLELVLSRIAAAAEV